MSNSREFIALKIAVVCVSDTRDLQTDKSGQYLIKSLTDLGHSCSGHYLVTDNFSDIKQMLAQLVERSDVDAVISTGGTGLTGRDVTVEAHREIYEKKLMHLVQFFQKYHLKR